MKKRDLKSADKLFCGKKLWGVSSGAEHLPPKQKTRVRFLHAPPKKPLFFLGAQIIEDGDAPVDGVVKWWFIPTGQMIIWPVEDDDSGDCELVSVVHTPTISEIISKTVENFWIGELAALHKNFFPPNMLRRMLRGRGRGSRISSGEPMVLPIIYGGIHAPPLDCNFPSRKRRTGVIEF